MDTFLFIAEATVIVAVIFLIAILIEKAIEKKTGQQQGRINAKKITMVGVFSAVSGVLMLIEIPLPFAPPFYKLDISEIPVLILGFAYGPWAGVLCEFLKVVIKLVLKGTSSAFVGDFANFVIGSTMILPASVIYLFRKSKKQAMIACTVGVLCMTAFGTVFNAVYLLPKFAVIYGMPMENIIALGQMINPKIDSVKLLVLFCVVPMNLLKGALDSVITVLLYKRLSSVIKADKLTERRRNSQ